MADPVQAYVACPCLSEGVILCPARLSSISGFICVYEAPNKTLRTSSPYHLPNILGATQLLTIDPMSHTPIPTPGSSSSNFQSIFDAALKDYEKKTKNDLLAHQLTAELKSCQSATAILAVLNRQCHVQEFIQSHTDGDGSKQWFNATLTVLCAFSDALGEGVSLVILW